MTDQHPITPPSELMEEWLGLWPQDSLVAAAQWGADQELEGCCEWLNKDWHPSHSSMLRAARRPKPPSLKEQALALIDACNDPDNDYLDDTALDIIRRALEALPND